MVVVTVVVPMLLAISITEPTIPRDRQTVKDTKSHYERAKLAP